MKRKKDFSSGPEHTVYSYILKILDIKFLQQKIGALTSTVYVSSSQRGPSKFAHNSTFEKLVHIDPPFSITHLISDVIKNKNVSLVSHHFSASLVDYRQI